MNTRRVIGILELFVGLSIVGIAVTRSAALTLPPTARVAAFLLFVAALIGWTLQHALLAKPYNMSPSPVIVGAILLSIPMGILILTYGDELLIAVGGSLAIAELYRQLLVTIEPREEEESS